MDKLKIILRGVVQSDHEMRIKEHLLKKIFSSALSNPAYLISLFYFTFRESLKLVKFIIFAFSFQKDMSIQNIKQVFGAIYGLISNLGENIDGFLTLFNENQEYREICILQIDKKGSELFDDEENELDKVESPNTHLFNLASKGYIIHKMLNLISYFPDEALNKVEKSKSCKRMTCKKEVIELDLYKEWIKKMRAILCKNMAVSEITQRMKSVCLSIERDKELIRGLSLIAKIYTKLFSSHPTIIAATIDIHSVTH